MPIHTRVKGGEKNKLSGVPFTKKELQKICDLYIVLQGKGIHENNPKIHQLAKTLNRTVRSVENQLLGFRSYNTRKPGTKNYNDLIPIVWEESKKEIVIKVKEPKVTKQRIQEEQQFKFRISSQLKNIIGKELITDDFIAIFELVKNSFDAHAKKIKIIIEEDKIIVWDDGKGMDRDDILNKWLFVAYSAKKEGIEDIELKKEEFKNYRNKINTNKRYAGAKGIGRFSADRLGSKLNVTTKKANLTSPYWQLLIDWDEFEVNAEDEFVNMTIPYKSSNSSDYKDFKHGTILEISHLRSVWPRKKILRLKWSLEKLINPFQELDKKNPRFDFGIEIICKKELEADNEEKQNKGFSSRNLVNGSIRNFIFETLTIKTTQIKSTVTEDGVFIETQLVDRGDLIYKTKELNEFNYLPNRTIVHLFYLNKTAKANFTRLMGIRPVEFGSIFLFNNGFRIFPVGEVNDDSFGIDKRKGQGYARYIGSRDLIGRIEIFDGGDLFTERSSREGALHNTVGTRQLEKFILSTLKRLEKFVQPILWQIKGRTGDENETIDLDAKTQIIDLVASFVGVKDIELVEYSKDFLNIVDEKLENTPPEVFDKLVKIAESTNDKSFINEIDQSKIEYIKLKKEKEAEKRKRIEAEEKAAEEARKKEEAEERLKAEKEKREKAEYERLKAEEETRKEREKRVLEEQRRRQRESQVRFLESVKSLDIEDVLNLNHQIGIDANTIETIVTNINRKLTRGKTISPEAFKEYMDDIVFATKKILAVVKFTTKQNFMAAARLTNDDIVAFLIDYLNTIYKKHLGKDINLIIKNKTNKPFVIEFKPIEITIIVDNLLSNSKKKNAKNAFFIFEPINDNILQLVYRDDGDGLDTIISNPRNIFEKGFTTTRGSGLGLYHVDKIMKEIGGSIEVKPTKDKGIELILKFSKHI